MKTLLIITCLFLLGCNRVTKVEENCLDKTDSITIDSINVVTYGNNSPAVVGESVTIIYK